jgi:DNA polymerase
MDKNEELKKIHERWFTDCKCELRKTATQPVPGHGNPEAKIVFIGEAPGKSEDEQGIPFVGAAGKFLAEMLEKIGLKRKEIYITNIVKYRPPNNRDPLPEEKDACREWLHEELNFIKPKLVVFLGRHSMNDFFPLEKISSVHGKLLIRKFQKIETKYFLPLYHPAAALYNGSMRETLMEDFQKIPKILEKIQKDESENIKVEQTKLF